MADVEVVVVGAGFAGIRAARSLADAGVEVVVLEARDRVGGRTVNERVGETALDLGAQWLGPTQDRALALLERFGLERFEQYATGDRALVRGGTLLRYRGLIPRIHPLDLAEVGWRIRSLDGLARKIPLDGPWTHPKAPHWDGMSAEAYLQKKVRRRGARDLIRAAGQMILADELDDISFLWFLFYLHAGGGIERLAEVHGGAQQWRVVGGTVQICERLAEGLDVRLGHPVRRIAYGSDGVQVEAGSLDVSARRAILAVPPALRPRMTFEPELPEAHRRLAEGMPMGSIIKTVVAYEKPFWRELGLSGECVFLEGPVRATFDDTTHDGSHAALVAFIVGNEARRLSPLPLAQRRQEVLEALATVYGDGALEPIDYVEKDWTADEWAGGCYVGLPRPGVLTRYGPALRAPVGPLHFAGTETARVWAGYLEGALESGERAAEEVLTALRS
ncbi:MAG: flavin monoamine oxidase family protein [Deltaproteobacteria bacterium]|nr:MAG: flavin monoamine oxidase family protein [Deltaproteobacteria bacterium]